MTRSLRLLELILLPAMSFPCFAGTTTHVEAGGIVRFEAEEFSAIDTPADWRRVEGIRGAAMQVLDTGRWSRSLRYDLQFQKPGTYRLWVRARKSPLAGQYGGNDIKVFFHAAAVEQVIAPGHYVFEIGLQDQRTFRWVDWPKNSPGNTTDLTVPEAGLYHLHFTGGAGEEWGWAIDSVCLINRDLEGVGPEDGAEVADGPPGSGVVPPARSEEPGASTQGSAVAFHPEEAAGQAPWPAPAGAQSDLALPPAWAFGVLYGNYCNQKELEERMQRLIEGDFPVDAMWVDSAFWDVSTDGPLGYINFTGDPEGFPEVRRMCEHLHAEGVRFGVWVWDRLSTAEKGLYAECEESGHFRGEPIVGNSWHNRGLKATSRSFDFDRPAAAAWWKGKMGQLVHKGVDFFKLDAGPAEGYIRTHFELTQQGGRSKGRGFLLTHVQRATLELIRRYPTAWTGDSLPAWTHPEFPDPVRWVWGGLREQVRMVADPAFGYYAYPFLTNDTGGFRNMTGYGRASDELYMRWVQFSALGAIMEVFGSMTFPAQNQPYAFSEAAQENFRRYTHLRMRLFPYLYSHAHLTRSTGWKMIQGESAHPAQYRLGRELLVAPVVDEGARSREVWLPAGVSWIDWWTGREWKGGQTINVEAPVDLLPLFVRAGSIIPLRDYARSIERGSNAVLTLEVWPRGTSSFSLIEDDGVSEAYRSGETATTTILCLEDGSAIEVRIGARQGAYEGAPASRIWRLRVRRPSAPQEVLVDGEKAEGWSFDRDEGIVTLEIARAAVQSTRVVIR